MTTSFAAVVYKPGAKDVCFLANFTTKHKEQGVKVAGFVQGAVHDTDGTFLGIDAVDVTTGARSPIKRVPRYDHNKKACALDASVLVGTSGVMRDAVQAGVDLIVFDKFGVEEQNGRGLSDEIFMAISDGIPLLISVPEPALEIWTDRTGGMGSLLPADVDALECWWDGATGK